MTDQGVQVIRPALSGRVVLVVVSLVLVGAGIASVVGGLLSKGGWEAVVGICTLGTGGWLAFFAVRMRTTISPDEVIITGARTRRVRIADAVSFYDGPQANAMHGVWLKTVDGKRISVTSAGTQGVVQRHVAALNDALARNRPSGRT